MEDAFLGPIEPTAALRSRAELFGEDRDAIEAMTSAYGVVDRDLVRDLARSATSRWSRGSPSSWSASRTSFAPAFAALAKLAPDA